MKARVLQTKIWNDEFFAELTPVEKLVFIYLITNESVNIIHMYECPDRKIVFETGISQKQLEDAKIRLERSGRVSFYKGYVFLRNGHKYQQYTGEKNDKSKDQIKREFSDDVLSWYKDKINTPIDTPINTTIDTPMDGGINTSHSHNHKHNHKGGVGGKEIDTFVKTYNDAFGKQAQVTKGRTDKLKQRLQNYSLDQILIAVVNFSKSNFHSGRNDREWVADPDFILRSDENIDKGLNLAVKIKKSVEYDPVDLEEMQKQQDEYVKETAKHYK